MPPHGISGSPSTPSPGGLGYHFSQRRGQAGAGSAPALATSPALQLSAQISL